MTVMKTRLLTLLAASALLILSCDRELPDYEHIHGKPDVEETEQEEDKPSEDVPQPTLGYEVSPTGSNAYIDGTLTLTFKKEPVLGTAGQIKIYKEDGTLVDMIDMADVAATPVKMENNTPYNTTMDVLGPKSLSRWRVVNYKPVTIEGKTVSIKPHSNTLEYEKSYYVTIDQTAIITDDFKGVKEKEWQFTTKKSPASDTEVTVAKDGDSDFRTVQAAIDWAYLSGQSKDKTIQIANGTYEEQLFARNNNKITFKGESRDGVVIQYTNAEELAGGVGGSTGVKQTVGTAIGKSGGRPVILIEACNDIRFENLTLKNTFGKPGQAEVIYNNSDGEYKMTFINCSLHSLQDTFNTKGYCWMYNCLVEGDCDFIWGCPRICLFENCEIRAAGDGYIVQARCQSSDYKGFVFLNCSLTKKDGVKDGSMYLARSGGSKEYYDNVAYINCTISSAIPSTGWYIKPIPNPSTANAVSGWKEYGSKDEAGNVLNVAGRASVSYQLTEAEYQNSYKDRSTIFASGEVGTDWME